MQALLVSGLLRCSSLLYNLNQSSCTRASGKEVDLWSCALSFCLGKLVLLEISCFWTCLLKERVASLGQRWLWGAESVVEAVHPFSTGLQEKKASIKNVHPQEEVIHLMAFSDSWISAALKECVAQLEAADL